MILRGGSVRRAARRRAGQYRRSSTALGPCYVKNGFWYNGSGQREQGEGHSFCRWTWNWWSWSTPRRRGTGGSVPVYGRLGRLYRPPRGNSECPPLMQSQPRDCINRHGVHAPPYLRCQGACFARLPPISTRLSNSLRTYFASPASARMGAAVGPVSQACRLSGSGCAVIELSS